LVLDEDLDFRLADTLKRRGYRDAAHLREHGLLGRGDHVVIPALRRLTPPVVLVTFDNGMPYEHGGLLRRLRLPVAVVDSRAARSPLTESEYLFDVVHRWAHRMSRMQPGEITWYSRDSVRRRTADSLPSLNRRERRTTKNRDGTRPGQARNAGGEGDAPPEQLSL
jgi:hypothetical protein